jgi:hypothetical protein
MVILGLPVVPLPVGGVGPGVGLPTGLPLLSICKVFIGTIGLLIGLLLGVVIGILGVVILLLLLVIGLVLLAILAVIGLPIGLLLGVVIGLPIGLLLGVVIGLLGVVFVGAGLDIGVAISTGVIGVDDGVKVCIFTVGWLGVNPIDGVKVFIFTVGWLGVNPLADMEFTSVGVKLIDEVAILEKNPY